MTVPDPDHVEYYFNTRTKMVEKGRQSSWEHLMGPYDTREEAQRALEIAEERNESWDEDNESWNNN